MNDLSRLSNGLKIRRPKKKRNIMNESRIRSCLSRYDATTYSRLQFLRAVSHSVGVHTEALSQLSADDTSNDSDSDDQEQMTNTENSSTHAAPVQTPSSSAPTTTTPTTAAAPATTLYFSTCEVCLIASPAGVALVPCGHARFCTACVDTSCNGRWLCCPLCRSRIDMVLRVFN